MSYESFNVGENVKCEGQEAKERFSGKRVRRQFQGFIFFSF